MSSSPTSILVSTLEITNFIPQKGSMVMIGELVFHGEDNTITRLKILDSNLFVSKGVLQEPGIVENIAQTIAIRVGYYYKSILKQEPPAGFIGAIRKLEIIELPKVNDIIETEITVIQEIFGVTMVNGEVRNNGKIIAHCEMKTVIEKKEDNT